MALSLKNAEVGQLVQEITALTGETKTEAIRRALVERRERLRYRMDTGDRGVRARRFLEEQVWPLVPEGEVGRRLTTAEEDEILGYGELGR
ncbi:MAG: type II toxin-antitoxin system VapB family antitoxin [Acidimicrobiales bacterium]